MSSRISMHLAQLRSPEAKIQDVDGTHEASSAGTQTGLRQRSSSKWRAGHGWLESQHTPYLALLCRAVDKVVLLPFLTMPGFCRTSDLKAVRTVRSPLIESKISVRCTSCGVVCAFVLIGSAWSYEPHAIFAVSRVL